MTMRRRICLILPTLALFAPAVIFSCRRGGAVGGAGMAGRERYVYRFVVMGTEAEITVATSDEETARKAAEAARQALDRVNGLMSDYIAVSDIGRLNRAQAGVSVPVDRATFEVLRKATFFAERTDGAFDITYAPLRRLWRECAKRGALPTPQELAQARALVGYANLILDDAACTVALAKPGMEVDLGGIAKGYGVDLAAAALRESGIRGGIVNVGGNMYLLGKSPSGGDWRVGVLDPARPDDKKHFLTTIHGHDIAVSTSGNYHRFFEIGGKRYSHIIDPRSGWPADNVPSVTVIAPDGITADALSTAISVLGAEEGLRFAQSFQDVEALIVENVQGTLIQRRTAGFSKYETDRAEDNVTSKRDDAEKNEGGGR